MRRESTFKPASRLLRQPCARALAALCLWCFASLARAQPEPPDSRNDLLPDSRRELPDSRSELPDSRGEREPVDSRYDLPESRTAVPHASIETRETPQSPPPSAPSVPREPSTKHAPYALEIEGHLVWQWNSNELAEDDGIGVGLRVSIPVMQAGPLPGFENNLALSLGLAWATFPGCRVRGTACSEDNFWIPAVAQWNFFLTPDISLFPELGLGFRDAVAGRGARCSGNCRRSSLEVHPAFWLGGRFHLGYDISLVARVGTPWLEVGVSYTM